MPVELNDDDLKRGRVDRRDHLVLGALDVEGHKRDAGMPTSRMTCSSGWHRTRTSWLPWWVFHFALKLRGAFAQNTLIGGPAGARRRWKLANRRPLRHGELSCPWRSRPRFPRSLRRRAVAGPPTLRLSRRTPT
eukprot:scaffold61996_cov64-Phaeocystis_antarctica.AAC.2